MKRFLAAHAFVASLVLLASSAVVLADNWPQWRGPTGDGISKEKNIPTKWSATDNILWKLPLPGISGATPIVWGDRIFLTGEDKGSLVLMCVSTEGKEIWRKKVGATGGYKKMNDEGSLTSGASPCTDGNHVFAFSSSGELACFDFTGKDIWQVDLQKRYGRFNIQFGMHSTPVLEGGRLYLQLMHTDANLVIALNAADGTEVWKVKRDSDGQAECLHSYASPVLWRKGAETYLITHGNDYAIAHSLKDGGEIWRLGGL